MNYSSLYIKLNTIPEKVRVEVIDFIEFLLSKNKKDLKKNAPKFGSAKGKFKMSPDFDAPLDDFKEYM